MDRRRLASEAESFLRQQQEQQSYHSPTLEQDGVEELSQGFNPGESHAHHDLHQLEQHLRGSLPPQQQHPRLSASVEELQLALQLSQSLAQRAPAAAAPSHTHGQTADGPHLNGGPVGHSQPSSQILYPQHHQPGTNQLQDTIFDDSPKKQSKVSRACDECRRKKIKCSVPSEEDETQACVNCKRAGIPCVSSRVPQKRGPSKGYIKELADRIHSIEGKLGGHIDGPGSERRSASGETLRLTPAATSNNRKRSFSDFAFDDLTTPLLEKSPPSNKHVQPTGRPPLPPASIPRALQQAPVAPMKGLEDASLPNAPLPDPPLRPHEIAEAVFESYLSYIHPIFPILGSEKFRVEALLSQCPASLCEAFSSILTAALRPHLEGLPNQLPSTEQLILNWGAQGNGQSGPASLVLFQIYILTVIESDNQGPASRNGRLGGGLSKQAALGRAAGHGMSMHLHHAIMDDALGPEIDPHSDDTIALRAWWALVMLDRWNSLATASWNMINEDSVVILRGLKDVMGDNAFVLIQLSRSLDYVRSNLATAPAARERVAAVASALVDSIGLQLPGNCATECPVLYQAFRHTHLVVDLFNPSRWGYLLPDIEKMIDHLVANPGVSSPLNLHYVSLVALTLAELSRTDWASRPAHKLMQKMLKNPSILTPPWSAAILGMLDRHSRSLTASAPDMNNLQQLADAATAPGAQDDDADYDSVIPPSPAVIQGHEFDPVPILRAGYLTFFDEPL